VSSSLALQLLFSSMMLELQPALLVREVNLFSLVLELRPSLPVQTQELEPFSQVLGLRASFRVEEEHVASLKL